MSQQNFIDFKWSESDSDVDIKIFIVFHEPFIALRIGLVGYQYSEVLNTERRRHFCEVFTNALKGGTDYLRNGDALLEVFPDEGSEGKVKIRVSITRNGVHVFSNITLSPEKITEFCDLIKPKDE